MTKRKIVFSAMMALVFLLSARADAFAQDPNRLTSLNISIWPEYDRPTVLVILNGVFADKGTLPREVSVLVPAKAEVIVTTYVNPDGRQAPEQVSRSTDLGDGFKRVTFTVATAEYWVEYYDDLLRGTPDKTMDFALKLGAPADQVVLEIQQPARATNFTSTPPTQLTRVDPTDGLSYYGAQFANLAAGQSVNAQIKYTRAETRLTKDMLAAAPSASSPATAAPQQPSVWQNAFLVAAAVVLGLVAVFGVFILRQRQTAPNAARQASRVPSKKGRRPQPANGTAAAFCTQCGRALRAEDNFCPRCGNKRRSV
ncbi:MAG: zinc ribbon domain-containing protein [Chloroflexi bacterium]|nr:zinc ribbon domain-containing protein [Chloroflexota bacterium]